MFRGRGEKNLQLETRIRQALADAPWLQSVRIGKDGRAILVIDADPDDIAASEARRIEAESIVRNVKGVGEFSVVLTAERAAAPKPAAAKPAPNPGPQIAAKIDNIDRILVVASGKGGVGKSTVAVNLAAAMAKAGMSVGLLDADIYGPSIPTMLGTGAPELEPGEAKKIKPVEAHGLQSLSIGYLSDPDAPMIWRGPVVMSAITQMLNDTAWGSSERPLDLLIIDTPPGTGDAQLTIAQRVPVDAALLVTTPQEVALADVRRGAKMFEKTDVPVLGLVETMSWFEDPAGMRHFLMGEGGGARMADALGLPLLAQLPLLSAIREGGDTGTPAALTDPAAQQLFTDLSRTVARALDQLQSAPPPEIIFED